MKQQAGVVDVVEEIESQPFLISFFKAVLAFKRVARQVISSGQKNELFNSISDLLCIHIYLNRLENGAI